jgi:predicted MFS family arabinose efflux permease
MATKSKAYFTLAILFAVNTLNFFDRLVIGAVGEPVRKEFGLTDSSLGLLSTAFVLVYAAVGIPLGWVADKYSRPKLLAAGVFVWSSFTVASGLARAYWQIALFRIGVGIGEASCAPAATSLISDIFPAEKRARAMSIFMLGLPVGIALSFYVSGTIAQLYGWRAAFIAAGIPGLLLAFAAFFIPEPRARRDSEPRRAPPYRRILASPTMRWLILSGALHNFCLYSLSTFMTPYLMRHHGLGVADAAFIAMFVNGIFTLPGLLLGGYLGDALGGARTGRALMLVSLATVVAIPLFAIAVRAEAGSTQVFLWSMGGAFALMYFYYSITYAAIADITQPGDRGTAMSVYFLAMYVLGGALGPLGLGILSDYFTRQAATAAGVADTAAGSLEQFRAAGLQSAMYVVPLLCILLAGVMAASALSIRKDGNA